MILRKFNVEKSETDPARVAELKADGFVVIKYDECEKKEKAEKEAQVDYSNMLKRELVEIALDMGIPGAKSLTKAELVEILEG